MNKYEFNALFFTLSQLCIIFAVPSTGKVTFVLYYVLHGIALGGINSALTNLIFEHIPGEKAADALAVTQAFAGLAGFVATLTVSPLVSYIQKSGNRIFGMPVYAQQLVTVLALAFKVVIPKMIDEGYSFVNIRELFEIKGITPKPFEGHTWLNVTNGGDESHPVWNHIIELN